MKRTISWTFLLVLALNLTACGQGKPGGEAIKGGMPWWVWVIIAVVALAIAFVALVYFKVIKLDLSFLKIKPKTETQLDGPSNEHLGADGLPIVPPPPDMVSGDLPPLPPPPSFAVGELPSVPPPLGAVPEDAPVEKPSKKKKTAQEPAPVAFGVDNLSPLPPLSAEIPPTDQPLGTMPVEAPQMPPPIPFPFGLPAQPPVQSTGVAPISEAPVEVEKKTTRRKKGEGETMPAPEINPAIPPAGMPLPPVPPPPSFNIPPMPLPSAPVDSNATVKTADKGLPPIANIPAATAMDVNATVKAGDKGLPPVPPMPMPVPPPPAMPQSPAVAAFCGNCGTKLPPQAKFCPTCGAKRIGA